MKSINLDVEVVQSMASFVMTQNYVNIEENPLETVYLYPTDVQAVLSKITTKFTLQDGTVSEMETKIGLREKVEAIYEDKVA